jgi:hypothetical protein
MTLTVKEVMEILSKQDPKEKCYFGMFDRFLTDDLKPSPGITDKEEHDVYDLVCEYKTVYQWCHRTQKHIPYTGVFFEVD